MVEWFGFLINPFLSLTGDAATRNLKHIHGITVCPLDMFEFSDGSNSVLNSEMSVSVLSCERRLVGLGFGSDCVRCLKCRLV
jgi:hypothetical protein